MNAMMINVFPPILTNRPQNKGISNFNNKIQEQSAEPSPQKSAADKFYFNYVTENDDEDEALLPKSSSASDYVENDWSDSEESSSKQRSREAQEAELQNKYRNAISKLNQGQIDRAVSLFTSILQHPIIANFHVTDWEAFDWDHANSSSSEPKIIPMMSKIYFNINLAMAGLVENPVPFYMQALSIQSDFDDLWFICGQAAFKKGDLRSAQFCFSHCAKEFRANEALLLVTYLDSDFFECTIILKRLFQSHPEHQLGHVIRAFISESSPIWKQLHENIFSRPILNFIVDKKQIEKVKQKIEQFKQTKFTTDFNLFRYSFKEKLPAYAPLTIEIGLGMRLEELGRIFCDLFDRVESFASMIEQKIYFRLTTRQEQISTNVWRSSIDIEEQQNQENVGHLQRLIAHLNNANMNPEEIVNSLESPNPKTINDQQMADNAEKIIEVSSHEEESGNDCVNQLATLKSFAQNKAKQRSKNKLDRIDECQENTGSGENTGNEEFYLRRSLRLIEDSQAFDSPLVQPSEEWTIFEIMNSIENDSAPTAVDQITRPRRSLPFDMNKIEIKELPSIDPLIIDLVNSSVMGCGNLLQHIHAFLVWIATVPPAGVRLTYDQAETFREVFNRWGSMVVNSTNLTDSSVLDIAIHQLAAELGSFRALSLLQMYYNNKLSYRVTYTDRMRGDESVHLANETEKEGPANDDTPSDAVKSELDMLKFVCARILKDQEQTPQKAKEHTGMMHDSMSIAHNFNDNSAITDFNAFVLDDYSAENSSEFRKMEIRFRWLVANLKPNELGLPNSSAFHFVHSYYQLHRAISIFEPDWLLWSNAEFEISLLSKSNLEEILRKKVRQYHSRQIDYLAETKRYAELKDVLLNYYDWKALAEDAHAKQILLLIECFSQTAEPPEVVFEWINKLLLLILQEEINSALSKRVLRNLMNILNETLSQTTFENLFTTNFQQIQQLGNLLAQIANPNKFPNLVTSIDLWLWCYRITKHMEAQKLNTDYLYKFYSKCDSDSRVEKRLPTRALMILSRAHEILGNARKCSKKEGYFLQFTLDEFIEILRHQIVHGVLISKTYQDIYENTTCEIFQCLHCGFSESFSAQSKTRSRYFDHGSKLQWDANWHMALQLLPLLLPLKLPEMSTDKRIVSFDLIEILTRLFGHLLSVDPLRLEMLNQLCQNPPRLEMIEQFDINGIFSGYKEGMTMDREGQERVRELIAGDTKISTNETKGKQDELKAQCLYLLAYYHVRSGSDDSVKIKHLRDCLSNGVTHLPMRILASAWHAYSINETRIYEYSSLSDIELIKKVDACLFPFKMAIYLNWKFSEAHLDIGTIMYQVRTRLMRLSMKENLNDELKKEIREKVANMLQECQFHFNLAQRFDIDCTKNVTWLSNYFLAKISEKFVDSAKTILEFYYQCALELEKDGYQYVQKIHRVKQIYFEPVEIHYKVHSFALRRLKELQSSTKMMNHDLYEEVAYIHAYLRLFQHHGIQRRSSDGHWSADEFYVIDKFMKEVEDEFCMNIRCGNSKDSSSVINDMVKNLVSAADHRIEIERLCRRAFEIIIQRFPHYKAVFRIGQEHFQNKNYKKAADILFEKLFLVGRKQRCNNFLENVVEIASSNFERNGSFPYHLCKIVKLSAEALYRSKDFMRLKSLIVALIVYEPKKDKREYLTEETVNELMEMCTQRFNKLVEELLQVKEAQNSESLGNLIGQIEDIIRRLKKDKKGPIANLESLWYKCIHRRDQLIPSTDEDIILLEAPSPQLSRFSNLPGALHTVKGGAGLQQLPKKPPAKMPQRQQVLPNPELSGFIINNNVENQLQQHSKKVDISTTEENSVQDLVKLFKMYEAEPQSNSAMKGQLKNMIQRQIQLMQKQEQEKTKNKLSHPTTEGSQKRSFPTAVDNRAVASSISTFPTAQQQPCSSTSIISSICQPPPPKKMKQIDEQAVVMLCREQQKGMVELKNLTAPQRDLLLRTFFEKHGYEYSIESLAKALEDAASKHRKQLHSTNTQQGIQKQQQTDGMKNATLDKKSVSATSSSMALSSKFLTTNVITTQSQENILNLTTPKTTTMAFGSQPHRRMSGLPPSIKPLQQQQQQSQPNVAPIPSKATKRSLPPASGLATKIPAVAIVHPTQNLQEQQQSQQRKTAVTGSNLERVRMLQQQNQSRPNATDSQQQQSNANRHATTTIGASTSIAPQFRIDDSNLTRSLFDMYNFHLKQQQQQQQQSTVSTSSSSSRLDRVHVDQNQLRNQSQGQGPTTSFPTWTSSTRCSPTTSVCADVLQQKCSNQNSTSSKLPTTKAATATSFTGGTQQQSATLSPETVSGLLKAFAGQFMSSNSSIPGGTLNQQEQIQQQQQLSSSQPGTSTRYIQSVPFPVQQQTNLQHQLQQHWIRELINLQHIQQSKQFNERMGFGPGTGKGGAGK